MSLNSRLSADGARRLQILGEDGERVFCRAWRETDGGQGTPSLPFFSASSIPPDLHRSPAHECELRDDPRRLGGAPPGGRPRSRPAYAAARDPGGEPSTGCPAPLEMGAAFAWRRIAAALGQLHQRGPSGDIKPANILSIQADGQVRLTGSGPPRACPRSGRPRPPQSIAGTLAYMAPEQTGRMNRSIDARSDLYSFGATLYQMLTGTLPFAASEPMEWVHCHIARKPQAPDERSATIPATVSRIVMKLLAKTAEARYQTALGVENDLRRCLAEWERQGGIEPFPLGEQDAPDRLLVPEKLYGRAREVETLLAAFDRVVEGRAPELVLVSGYSGIGKSSVVQNCTGCSFRRAVCSPRASSISTSAASPTRRWRRRLRASSGSFWARATPSYTAGGTR